MRLQSKAYSERLDAFATFTLVLLSELQCINREAAYKACDITSDPELNEEQIVEKLLELRRSYFNSLAAVSYDDALKIVCDALEGEYYCPLYELLDENAAFIFADEDHAVLGNREIISFIVNARVEHIRCDKEAVTCDILRVAEGERFGVGEKCILFTYHYENGKKQNRIIKVRFDHGKIRKLESFYPFGPLRLVSE